MRRTRGARLPANDASLSVERTKIGGRLLVWAFGFRAVVRTSARVARGVFGTWIALNVRVFRDPGGDVVCSPSFLRVFVTCVSRPSGFGAIGRGCASCVCWTIRRFSPLGLDGWLSDERALGTWNRVDSGRRNACANLIFGSDELHALIGRSIRIRYPEGALRSP